MRLGVFGGSFNPPHIGHLAVAEAARDAFRLDRVLWIPNHQPPHKELAYDVSPEHRLAMATLCADSNDAFSVDAVEVNREGKSFTVDTLAELRDRYSESRLFLIIGGDSLAAFDTWRQPDEIAKLATLLVYSRTGSEIESAPPVYRNAARRIEAPQIDVSSSAIREHVTTGRSVRHLVTESVAAYIESHNLYTVRPEAR